MNTTKINRADIFNWIKLENPESDPEILREILEESTDVELAKSYGLKILRSGIFYR